MLKLTVRLSESYDDEKDMFVYDDFVLELEHSLVSLSKWESKFEKPFLDSGTRTEEEVLGYIQAMIITPEYPTDILNHLTEENVKQIQEYIDAKMSATWFNEMEPAKPNREKITSELIYYWLVSYQIPWEVETWHLNRLFTLIKVFGAKNGDKKKVANSREAFEQRKALNEQRRKQLNTSG